MRRGRVATVYVMEDDAGRRKIGHSANPSRRSFEIGKTPLRVVHEHQPSSHAYKIEKAAHRLLRLAGKHIEGELFTASIEECVAAIERAERIVAGLEPDVGPVIELVGVRFTAEKMEEIEDWWRNQRTIRNRVDAIRALVDEGLESFKKKDGAKERKPR